MNRSPRSSLPSPPPPARPLPTSRPSSPTRPYLPSDRRVRVSSSSAASWRRAAASGSASSRAASSRRPRPRGDRIRGGSSSPGSTTWIAPPPSGWRAPHRQGPAGRGEVGASRGRGCPREERLRRCRSQLEAAEAQLSSGGRPRPARASRPALGTVFKRLPSPRDRRRGRPGVFLDSTVRARGRRRRHAARVPGAPRRTLRLASFPRKAIPSPAGSTASPPHQRGRTVSYAVTVAARKTPSAWRSVRSCG